MWVYIPYIYTYIIPHVNTYYLYQNVHTATYTNMRAGKFFTDVLVLIIVIVVMKCINFRCIIISISFTSPNLKVYSPL